MSRGKYANRAEASRDRDRMRRDLEAALHERDRLANALAELQEEHDRSVRVHIRETDVLRRQVLSGTSVEVEQLKGENKRLQEVAASEFERARALFVAVLADDKFEVRGTREGYAEMADALGMAFGEFLSAVGSGGNRTSRRATSRSARQIDAIRSEMVGQGIDPDGIQAKPKTTVRKEVR